MEQNINLEKAAALALLDRGVAFRIPAPWLLKLFGKKTAKITVKRLYLGTLVHLSALENFGLENVRVPEAADKLIKDMDSVPRSIPIAVIVNQAKPVCRAIACCLLNSRLKIALFSKALGCFLGRNCTTDQLQELAMWLFVYGRPEAFTNTTRFLSRMTMTSPRMMGQMERS